jgi:hypothetical protein
MLSKTLIKVTTAVTAEVPQIAVLPVTLSAAALKGIEKGLDKAGRQL